MNILKLPKQKSSVVVGKAKRRLENPVTEAQKAENAAVDAERLRKIQRITDKNSERLRVMAERRSAVGAEGLAANASRNSTRRKLHPLTVEEITEKARAEAEKRSVAEAEFLVPEATRISARRKINPLTAEQKAEKAVADVVRNRQSRLTVDQKAEKDRIETERRNAENSQATVVQLLDRRHRYATRSATVADSVVANASISNKVLNVQPKSDPDISFSRTARASREVQSDARQREAARA